MTDKSRYFEKARTWATDTQAQDAKQRRIAWTIAGVATGVALFEAVALALLTPLKTVQPITLLVDRQTGYVQALDPLQPKRIGGDAALTQSLLAQYVAAREGFDRATVRSDYRRIALWSMGPARSDYLAMMPATNPQSPLQRYPLGTVVETRVKSVSALSEGTALVRFDTQRLDRGGNVGSPQSWISVVRYRYSDGPMRFEDRLINPLGFQVTSYRRDTEAPLERPEPVTAVAPAASAGPERGSAGTANIIIPATDGAQKNDAAGRRAEVRNVPINQIPLGSPLAGRPYSAPRGTNGAQS